MVAALERLIGRLRQSAKASGLHTFRGTLEARCLDESTDLGVGQPTIVYQCLTSRKRGQFNALIDMAKAIVAAQSDRKDYAMAKKILVTGATGTVGSEVVKQLAATGATIRAAVQATSKTDRIKQAGAEPF